MKVKFLSLVMAILALSAITALTSCKEETQFEKLDKEGYTISVTFDANGGDIKGAKSNLIDVFNPDKFTVNSDGKIEISIIPPDDEGRDKNNKLTFSKPGESFVGWYTERSFKNGVDDKDGYTYSGLWNFEEDKLVLDPNGNYTSAQSQLTLYAAWVPKVTFNIYAKDDNGNQVLLEEKPLFELDLPKWEEGEPQISMGDIADRKGYTFDKAYSDENCTEPIEAETLRGIVDMETGTLESKVVNVYTTWLDGTHFKIYRAKDMRLVTNDGICHIMNDIDFSDTTWTLNSRKFSGILYGNGHKISNVTLETTSAGASNGLFAEIAAGAKIENVIFENITHTVDVGRVTAGASFGLFAGKASADAVFENVSVSGKLLFGTNCNNLKNYENIDYTIGIFAANGTPSGIDAFGISVSIVEEDSSEFSINTAADGEIKLVFDK